MSREPRRRTAVRTRTFDITMCSTDGDFARFPDLTWLNPLATWKRPVKVGRRRIAGQPTH